MYEPAGPQLPGLAFLWPAFAAASASEIAVSIAKQFADLALGSERSRRAHELQWATPNTVALELNTVRLRDFSVAQEGVASLICAPFALHGAAVADLAPGHSLVATLRDAGLRRVFVTDWRPATAEMRFLGIDDYLADLNVLVDHSGGSVDLVGLCQGGWMALLYAARFPAKVRKLVLAGAPIDIAAGPSCLSALADASPLAMFQELVQLGDGRILGHEFLKLWGPETPDSDDIREMLQTADPVGSRAGAEHRPRCGAGPDLPAGGARRRGDRTRAAACNRTPGWHTDASDAQGGRPVSPSRAVHGKGDPPRVLAEDRPVARRTLWK